MALIDAYGCRWCTTSEGVDFYCSKAQANGPTGVPLANKALVATAFAPPNNVKCCTILRSDGVVQIDEDIVKTVSDSGRTTCAECQEQWE